MKVSYRWLQRFFDEPLPDPQELYDLLTFHSFELEGLEEVAGDTVLDIDVLPNRSSDCLSHRGVAREIATLLRLPIKEDPLYTDGPSWNTTEKLSIAIAEEELVNRFSCVLIEGVEVKESPSWLKEALEAIGQKPINNIVDATNYVMFNLGQPLHAFDADKFTDSNGYTIKVRLGKDETITTLTGEEYPADENTLLIADGNSDALLGIAGIKGGKEAEIDSTSKNLIIEAANFNYVHVRKTSQRLKLVTDASVRFQNEPVPELTVLALRDVVALIIDIAGGEVVGMADWYPRVRSVLPVSFSTGDCNNLLGTRLSHSDVADILNRFGWRYEQDGDDFNAYPPFERTDLNIKEDMVEEIGRVSGYRQITPIELPDLGQGVEINKRFYYAEKVRNVLVQKGFSEVYTYTLRDSGQVKLANDKSAMRKDLTGGLEEALITNTHNAPLLGLEEVRIFEIGTVFTKKGEHTALGLAVAPAKGSRRKGTALIDAIAAVEAVLGVTFDTRINEQAQTFEINLDEIIENLPDPDAYELFSGWSEHVQYSPYSVYPFVLRDIALWVEEGVSADDVEGVIRHAAGKDILVRVTLFDTYEKDGKMSYAFRLVFQSYEKTLTDAEINPIMDLINTALSERGWQVR